MCGFLYARNVANINKDRFIRALQKQKWRGPDNEQIEHSTYGAYLGHVRLAIIDPDDRSSQPFTSACGRYSILFNGEIYNHEKIRQQLGLSCRTTSDTETILESFVQCGDKIFNEFEGMFAFIIHDSLTGDFVAVRDRYGIKPLFMYSNESKGTFILSSECVSIRDLVTCQVDELSLKEWRLIRRPMRGRSFFKEIREVLPGSVVKSGVLLRSIPPFEQNKSEYNESEVNGLLINSIKEHQLSDVENVSLLSGGIDSSIITAYSQCNDIYTVGMRENNEFNAASQTASFLKRHLNVLEIPKSHVEEVWHDLIKVKGEPLYLPNEALIYSVCRAMTPKQKVVLTGEGADEVFFGYDRIYRWAVSKSRINLKDFLEHYAYSNLDNLTDRLREDLETLLKGKKPVDFVEDFFFSYHLVCLLRRMDFASMAASKEARVPFVCRKIINYMYRRSPTIKISIAESKIPLRKVIEDIGLTHVLDRKKIGFSATIDLNHTRHEEYEKFQYMNLETLGWL